MKVSLIFIKKPKSKPKTTGKYLWCIDNLLGNISNRIEIMYLKIALIKSIIAGLD